MPTSYGCWSWSINGNNNFFRRHHSLYNYPDQHQHPRWLFRHHLTNNKNIEDTYDNDRDHYNTYNDNISDKIRWIFEDDNEEVDEDDYYLTGDDEKSIRENDNGIIELHVHDMSQGVPAVDRLPPNRQCDKSTTVIAASKTSTLPPSSPIAGNEVSLDTLSSNLSYFYLRDEIGLSEDIMWKVTNHASSVLGLKASTVRNKVKVLKSLVGFTDLEIKQLITSNPSLLQLSAKKNIAPTILFWIRQLGIGKEELKILILGCPSLLKYSRSNVSGKLAFFQQIMGYSLPECRNLLLKKPSILTASVKTGLIPRLNFLNKEVEILLPDIRKIISKNPNIFTMSVEQNLQPKIIFYFIMTLRMKTNDIGKMLLKYPEILDYNMDNHILPIHHYFLSLDFSTQEFSRIIRKFPRIISPSLIRIKSQIGYLRFELYLEANAIRRIIHQCPQVVSLGQENLKSKVEFILQAVAPGATLEHNINMTSYENSEDGDEKNNKIEKNLSSRNGSLNEDLDALTIVQIVFTGLPTLFGCSVEKNLKPKVHYLRYRLGQEELSRALIRLPPLLGYSLEKRIRPRLERILEAGIPSKKITVAITLKEDAFQEWIRKQQIKYSFDDKVSGRTNNDENIRNTKKDNAEEIEKTTECNTRVIEEGGKIIHWRR